MFCKGFLELNAAEGNHRMLSSLILSLVPNLNPILIKVILISSRFAMEHGDHRERDADSSASLEQNRSRQDDSIHNEEEDHTDGAPIDPIRQLQDAMIHMAENQTKFFERQPGQPIQ